MRLGNPSTRRNTGLLVWDEFWTYNDQVQDFEIVLELALEIIHEINLKRKPNPETVEKLEAVLSPRPMNISLDVWVCDAIKNALEKKAQARTKTPATHL